MKRLNLNAYRFSIAWPRIFPEKSLSLNGKGLAFYDRLIDRLLELGIEPFPTLYHWDLPQYIQDRGGWASREACHYFADYAAAVYSHFQDRVEHWTTLNEPYISAFMGYLTGIHAPGIKSQEQALAAVHHLMLAHGLAGERLRAVNRGFPLKVGIALNLSPVCPLNSESQEAAEWYDTLHNQLFLDALFKGVYPDCGFGGLIQAEDMVCISSPLDFLGVNYYTRGVVEQDPAVPLLVVSLSPLTPIPIPICGSFIPRVSWRYWRGCRSIDLKRFWYWKMVPPCLRGLRMACASGIWRRIWTESCRQKGRVFQ